MHIGIEGVIFQEKVDGHKSPVREISVIFNADIEGFSPLSIRGIRLEQDGKLSNHWRECKESLYHLSGPQATVHLASIGSRQYERYVMNVGSRLFIPERTALMVEGKSGLILVSMIDRVYVEGAEWHHKLENPHEFWAEFSRQ